MDGDFEEGVVGVVGCLVGLGDGDPLALTDLGDPSGGWEGGDCSVDGGVEEVFRLVFGGCEAGVPALDDFGVGLDGFCGCGDGEVAGCARWELLVDVVGEGDDGGSGFVGSGECCGECVGVGCGWHG